MDNATLRRPATLLLSRDVFAGISGHWRLHGAGGVAEAPQPMPMMVLFTVAHVAVGSLAVGARVALAMLCAARAYVGATRGDGHRVMRDYIELTKPRITWLILMSTGIGYFFGLPSHAWIEFDKSYWIVAAAHDPRHGADRLGDGRAQSVVRARGRSEDESHGGRPLPSGRLVAGRALASGLCSRWRVLWSCGWESICSAA